MNSTLYTVVLVGLTFVLVAMFAFGFYWLATKDRPPRYYLHAPIIGALASQARHDSRPQSLMIRGVLSPG
ncbi:hypothetical protein J6351_26265, partial [Burkholderia pseudomallei]|nr:hypothetical protein [Burkholderia pseudomallei]